VLAARVLACYTTATLPRSAQLPRGLPGRPPSCKRVHPPATLRRSLNRHPASWCHSTLHTLQLGEPLGAPPGDGGGFETFGPPATVGLGGTGNLGYQPPATNAGELATAGGDFGMDQPSSQWTNDGGYDGGMEVQGTEGWGMDELENALPKDLKAALKKYAT
jgi:hypothetical protein